MNQTVKIRYTCKNGVIKLIPASGQLVIRGD